MKKEEIIAKLSVRGLPKMDKKQLKLFYKWLQKTVAELMNEDPNIFSKSYRATLYK